MSSAFAALHAIQARAGTLKGGADPQRDRMALRIEDGERM
jgi:hypothetical protein